MRNRAPERQNGRMPMRHECKHYESRTYGNGETVRKCNLDLAPDAPWRCPDKCPGFERRMDMGWTYGTAVSPPTPDEPPGLLDGSAAAVLDEAEDHLNAVGAQIMAEVAAERGRRGTDGRSSKWKLFRRKGR
jgi:hypothetical protein